jgi:hypothetical protein
MGHEDKIIWLFVFLYSVNQLLVGLFHCNLNNCLNVSNVEETNSNFNRLSAKMYCEESVPLVGTVRGVNVESISDSITNYYVESVTTHDVYCAEWSTSFYRITFKLSKC